MVFSLFSRKSKVRPERAERGRSSSQRSGDLGGTETLALATTRMPDTMAERRALARLTAEKIDQIELEMIAVGLVKPVRRMTAATNSPATHSPLASAPPPAKAFAAPASPAQDVQRPSLQPLNSNPNLNPNLNPKGVEPLEQDADQPEQFGRAAAAGQIAVSASALPAALEEAAILFANGQKAEAAATLREAIKAGALGDQMLQGWLMLLDVLRAMGEREAFDTLSLQFAARFEKSPPAWRDSGEPPTADTPPAAAVRVSFPPALDATCVTQIEQARRGVSGRRPVMLELSAVRSLDDEAAQRLLDFIIQCRDAGSTLVLSGAPKLSQWMRSTLEVGSREAAPARWMLVLELLRAQGLRENFDDLAIDYCVTFEVSPPSWEPMPACIRTDLAAAVTVGAADALPAVAEQVFALRGEVAGRIQKELAALRAWAAPRHHVVIDCRELVRLDFVAAGELLNELAALRGAGKSVVFLQPDFIVIALMQVMGIHELADIRQRKI